MVARSTIWTGWEEGSPDEVDLPGHHPSILRLHVIYDLRRNRLYHDDLSEDVSHQLPFQSLPNRRASTRHHLPGGPDDDVNWFESCDVGMRR